jgi:hypothetical protein
MIQTTAQMRVLVAIEPVDGRKGIDSLARLCQEKRLTVKELERIGKRRGYSCFFLVPKVILNRLSH